MTNDPHEQGWRLPEVKKNEGEERFLGALNSVLASHFPRSETVEWADLPVIYVVGAPRSGTTLMSQLLSRYLQVGYIDNVIARFWLAPEVGIRLSKILLGTDARKDIAFESRHGVTAQMAGPHEFGYFWRYWLRLDEAKTHHLSDNELNALDRSGLKDALEHRLLAAFGMPMLFKNVVCGFQAPFLTSIHPNSIFIHVKRDLGDTVASILRSRFERYGSYATWWSLKPSTFERLPADPVEQVVAQVVDCRFEIDEALAKSGACSLQIDYADFCHNPNQVIEQVCGKVKMLGAELTPLAVSDPFKVSGRARIPTAMQSRINAVVAGCSEG